MNHFNTEARWLYRFNKVVCKIMKHINIVLILFLSSAISTYAHAGQPLLFTVGNGIGCNFSNIQDAIDEDDNSEIRIASNKDYFESLVLQDKQINLVGGFENCAAALSGTMTDTRPLITGNSSESVITISGFNLVELKNLFIGNGIYGVEVVNFTEPVTSVKMDNVRVFNNDTAGFGITTANGSDANVSLNNVQSDFNKQTGINCSGAGSHVRLGGSSIIDNNHVASPDNEFFGSGIRAFGGCQLDIYSPTQIMDNSAPIQGGGIHVDNGATVNIFGFGESCINDVCMGDSTSPVIIKDNTVDSPEGNGGGIYISQATVNIFNAVIEGNTAAYGGALYTRTATFNALGLELDGVPCWSPGQCLQFNDNEATIDGGVFYGKFNGSLIQISNARFNDNLSGNAVIGSLDEATANIRNSIITDNGGISPDFPNNHLFQLEQADATLDLNEVTIHNNVLSAELIKNNDGEVNVYSSLIFDFNQIYSQNAQASNNFSCIGAHEINSFQNDPSNTVINLAETPVFIDTVSGNYLLTPNSLAIDYCGVSPLNNNFDIAYNPRGVDDPDVDDLLGTYDIGAYEYQPGVANPAGIKLTLVGDDDLTSEIGDAVLINVSLSKEPVTNVSINVSSDDESEGLVTAGSLLEFKMGNWDQPQQVVVTGQDDEFVDGDISYNVIFDVSSMDPEFNGNNISQPLTNVDDGSDLICENVPDNDPDIIFKNGFDCL